jgi:hypothetical protein
MKIDPDFKAFMDNIWSVSEINGVKVIARHLGFGALPDIKFAMADGSFISAKKLWEEVNV